MPKKEKVQVEVEVKSKKISVHHAACPNGHQLCCDEAVKIHDKPGIKVKVRYKDKTGFVYLDPTYGSYDNLFEGIDMPKGSVAEFFCPQCDVSLTDPHETCQLCSSPMFVFHLPKGGIIEGCLRKGCMFHKMKIVDAEQQVARMFENNTMESFL